MLATIERNTIAGSVPPQKPLADSFIAFGDVSKIYRKSGAAVSALERISLSVPEGSIYGIIGQSGAGKSTLLRLINGLEKPSSGAGDLFGTTSGGGIGDGNVFEIPKTSSGYGAR
jgi:ABC-type glutathione transport system ATPase component